MAEAEERAANGAATSSAAEAELAGSGSYEVLRSRLAAHAAELEQRARAVDAARTALFGVAPPQLLATTRVRTENACVARDVVQVGGHLLVGFDVHLGRRQETRAEDVLALYAPGDQLDAEPTAVPLDRVPWLADEDFRRKLDELHRYYRDARLQQLRAHDGRLLAVFQQGRATDTRVFRWRLAPEGTPLSSAASYVDDRGERDHVVPPSHDFEWVRATREQYVAGRFPHVNILDTIFVETTGGDLTVKIENNTDTGEGVWAEKVNEGGQTLDDAEFSYAALGSLILLRIKPYNEAPRFLVYNRLTHAVHRIDALERSCITLPEDHGVVFPGGFYLQDGTVKLFELPAGPSLGFLRRVDAPNGEDVLYVFYDVEDGSYQLLAYNLIRREVERPLLCQGWSLFEDGRLVLLRGGPEPVRVHTVQLWTTPFESVEHAARRPPDASPLGRIGNAELVRAISECLALSRVARELSPSRRVFDELRLRVQRAIDAHHWLAEPVASGLGATLVELRRGAEQVLAELDKVEAIRKRAGEALSAAQKEQASLLAVIRGTTLDGIEATTGALASLRLARGKLVALKEQRAIDVPAVEALEAEARTAYEELSRRTAEFLLGDRALTPMHTRLAELTARFEKTERSVDLKPIREDFARVEAGITELSEVIGSLQIADPLARTRILEGTGELLGQLNRARAIEDGRRRELALHEGRAEFGAQLKLLAQATEAAVARSSTPEACDEELSRLLVQLEEVEGRFGDVEELLPELTTRRTLVHEALSAKKQQLLEARQKRAGSLMEAATRLFDGIGRRTKTISNGPELEAFFAADPLVEKLRDVGRRLRELGDVVRAEELEGRLKGARQEALRGQRDRAELFDANDPSLIRLGRHAFAVGRGTFELSIVPRDGVPCFHVSGTDYHAPIEDPRWDQYRDLWDQALVSETASVYRAEHLAAALLFDAEAGRAGLSVSKLLDADRSGKLTELVREFASARPDEGYDRGVHDVDATAILSRVLSLSTTAGLLRHGAGPRAWATLAWARLLPREEKERLERRGRSLGRLRASFASAAPHEAFAGELAASLSAALRQAALPLADAEAAAAGRYLAEQLATGPRFVSSAEAVELRAALLSNLSRRGGRRELEEDLNALRETVREQLELARAWLEAFIDSGDDELGVDRTRLDELRPAALETAVLLVSEGRVERDTSAALTTVLLTGLLGQHPRVSGGKLTLRLDHFVETLRAHHDRHVPRYQAYRALRAELLEAERLRLKLEELRPRALAGFVRNQLIDGVYLPLIGANLAKQLGAAGDAKRSDRMGLLLLLSPPGYGKTTLMEWLAVRLGLAFVKVNGPSLGHEVTSLDPSQAKSSTARLEVEKIAFAFELGSDVMLYLDDVQHTSPELLQRFISLCDAQRKVEAVYRGRTRSYDLRGKRFCIVMAGNPYTETGERFRIPDMLANRADTFNLGEVLAGKDDLFRLSYLENAVGSSPVLAPIAARSFTDLRRFIAASGGAPLERNELEHDVGTAELDEILSVLRKLGKLQSLLLAVNQEYVRSAAMADAYRTEPPFKLQGSYRNMNKLAEKVVAALDDAELERLIDDHYSGEAQTLTTGAEENLLKLAELRGRLTDVQRERLAAIRREFRRSLALGGAEEDPVVRVTAAIGELSRTVREVGTLLGVTEP